MRIIAIIGVSFALFGIGGSAKAAVPSLQWATMTGSTGSDIVRGASALPDGSVLLAGYLRGTVAFGSTNLTSAGSSDGVIGTMTSGGAFTWATRAGGAGADFARHTVALPNGDLVYAASLNGTSATVDGTAVTGAGSDDMLLARFSYGTLAPGSVTATVTEAGATVEWTPPTRSGAPVITGYTANVVEDPTRTCSTTGTSQSCVIAGLPVGIPYTFAVTVQYADGSTVSSGTSNAVSLPTTSGGATVRSEDSTATSSGATATAASSPLRLTQRLRCRRASCVSLGTAPAGATRIVQRAVRVDRARVGTRAPLTRAATCSVERTSASLRYRCAALLGQGSWVITTEALAGDAVLATTDRRAVIRQSRPAPVASGVTG
jgi:hypothetical protein